jgi:two-component system invasion response regulator UvrY
MNNLPVIYIAIADDHEIVTQGVTELINSHHADRFNVYIQAKNGSELMDKLAHASHLPDICLIDIGMKPMDGYETTVMIRKQYPFIKCIAFSMIKKEFAILKMYKNGCSAFVLKNGPVETLLEVVNEVYTHGICFPRCVLDVFPKISIDNLQEHIDSVLLKDREEEFLALCGEDKTYKEIGAQMNLSHKTVENEYAIPVRNKLGIRSRVGLALYALMTGVRH